VSWNWSFGNGQVSLGQQPPPQKYQVPFQNTNYPVELVVVDSSNCADTAVNYIKVVNNCIVQVPNAFTPNGDGHNDYLYPLNAWKATELRFRVYSRYGQVVFESGDWTKKWDGTLGGKMLATGTYVWTLEYTDDNKKHIFLKGTTVLIR
jgi:gliding motility-associated-like protein